MRPRHHQPHRRPRGPRPHPSGAKVDTPDTLSRFGVRPDVMARLLEQVTPEMAARGTFSAAQYALMEEKPREAERYQIMTLRFIRIAEGLETLRKRRESREIQQALHEDFIENHVITTQNQALYMAFEAGGCRYPTRTLSLKFSDNYQTLDGFAWLRYPDSLPMLETNELRQQLR